jgi:transposase-like protein
MKPSEVEAENRRLRRELAHVSEQRDILKKAISIFSQEGRGRTSSS